MQDVGGCRIILQDKVQVENVVKALEQSGLAHPLHNKKDYIESPKHTGYRGVHLIYKFKGQRTTAYDNLRIEVQVRTMWQHAWATAIELLGEMARMALKKDMGDPKWRRFFALMGSVLADREMLPLVPNTGRNIDAVKSELFSIDDEINIYNKLKRYQLLPFTETSDRPDGHYFLIIADYERRSAKITGYDRKDLLAAERAYRDAEMRNQEGSKKNIVLVSVDSINNLKSAFPNYLGDARLFMDQVDRIFERL